MKLNSFIIEIVDGVIQWKSDEHKKLFRRWLRQFPEGKYRIEINTTKSRMSDNQRRYYWGVYLPIISEETGHSTDELHSLFKGMFLSDIKDVMGKPTRIAKSITSLNKSEFSEYIINIEQYTGIPAPDTTAYTGYYPKNV